MKVESNNFIALADIALAKESQRDAIRDGTLRAYHKRNAAMNHVSHAHGESLREAGKFAKRRSLNKLPDLLEQAEARMTAKGIKVLWALDAEEARQQVLHLCQQHHIKTIIKSKSMLTEEIALNKALEAAALEVVETDLGEFIIQLMNEPPSHIVAPVIHRTKSEIRDIFIDKLGMPFTDDPGEMVAFARKVLRDKFMNADLGISGANFIIAETGSIALVTNEGNGRLVSSIPPVHIALVGIEKTVETLADYALLTQTLPRSGTGQALTVYTNIINAPKLPDELDGPEHVYVIFIDNGRSRIYSTDYAEALTCLRCGACQNACPVYRSVGGHAYGWVYGGPIGAVISPLLVGLDQALPLPHASSLCGSCKEVCPVDIDIPRMLLELRADEVTEGHGGFMWSAGMKSWQIGNQSPRLFELGATMARNGQKLLGDNLPFVLGNWTKYRDFPDFAPKSFRQTWREQRGHNDD
ncbi:lactate utilization protein B [Anaerolineales bacterium]